MKLISCAIFFLFFSALVLSQCVDGTECSDNDECTGTISFPDTCADDICMPGAPYCPLYSKDTLSKDNEQTGTLDITNDDKWLYLVWNSKSEFQVTDGLVYISTEPPTSDNSAKFPYQISTEPTTHLQVRVNLELLDFPSEMDPIYVAFNAKDESGADSWMSGFFTPKHYSHGGKYGYTSVCHCNGYSHVKKLVDFNADIFSFSGLNVNVQDEIELDFDSAQSLMYVPIMLLAMLFLSM